MENNEYILLLRRFLTGEMTPAEKQVLSDWFKSDLSRGELDGFVRSKWEEAANGTIHEDLKERMFQRIQSRIITDTGVRSKNKVFSFRNVIRYVAVILLVVGTGFGSHLYTRHVLRDVSTKDYLVCADKAQKASLVLPDGTKVWLNSDSEIKYTSMYGEKERRISLDGQAYFEVAKDSLRRFIVQAGDLAVEALGTSFDVKAYHEDNLAVVTLFQGKVKASTRKEETFLLPDQSVTYNKEEGHLRMEMLSDASSTCLWRNNELSFRDVPLSEIATLLNRMYNIQVQFKTESVKHLRFTGVITNNSLENIIELISLTSPIKYTSKGDTIIIDKK